MRLLEIDPALGALLDPVRRRAAALELLVTVVRLHVGVWDEEPLAARSVGHLGLLIVDGVLAREILLEDRVSTELLGAGDLLRVRHIDADERLLKHEMRWNVLHDVQLAFLDRRFVADVNRYPELYAALLDRIDQRVERMAVDRAIMQLHRVDRRLLALFWHLSERWGHVTGNGIVVPIYLSHRMIGDLIGARRPTVTTALNELARTGQLQRPDDGSWLLPGEPVGLAMPEIRQAVPVRRRLVLDHTTE